MFPIRNLWVCFGRVFLLLIVIVYMIYFALLFGSIIWDVPSDEENTSVKRIQGSSKSSMTQMLLQQLMTITTITNSQVSSSLINSNPTLSQTSTMTKPGLFGKYPSILKSKRVHWKRRSHAKKTVQISPSTRTPSTPVPVRIFPTLTRATALPFIPVFPRDSTPQLLHTKVQKAIPYPFNSTCTLPPSCTSTSSLTPVTTSAFIPVLPRTRTRSKSNAPQVPHQTSVTQTNVHSLAFQPANFHLVQSIRPHHQFHSTSAQVEPYSSKAAQSGRFTEGLPKVSLSNVLFLLFLLFGMYVISDVLYSVFVFADEDRSRRVRNLRNLRTDPPQNHNSPSPRRARTQARSRSQAQTPYLLDEDLNPYEPEPPSPQHCSRHRGAARDNLTRRTKQKLSQKQKEKPNKKRKQDK